MKLSRKERKKLAQEKRINIANKILDTFTNNFDYEIKNGLKTHDAFFKAEEIASKYVRVLINKKPQEKSIVLQGFYIARDIVQNSLKKVTEEKK